MYLVGHGSSSSALKSAILPPSGSEGVLAAVKQVVPYYCDGPHVVQNESWFLIGNERKNVCSVIVCSVKHTAYYQKNAHKVVCSVHCILLCTLHTTCKYHCSCIGMLLHCILSCILFSSHPFNKQQA